MSYEIVKAISIVNNEVFITSNSNNVFPRIPKKWAASYFTDILQSQGREALDKYILQHFIDGNLQGNSTIYGKVYAAANTSDLPTLYAAYSHYTTTKHKVIVKRGSSYFLRTTARRAFLTDERKYAKPYILLDAMLLCKRFTDLELVKI